MSLCRINPHLAICMICSCQAYNWSTLIKGLISLLRRSSPSSSQFSRSSDDSRTDDSRYFLVLQKQKYSSSQIPSLVSDCEIEVVGMQQNQENQSMSDQNTEAIVLRFSNTQSKFIYHFLRRHSKVPCFTFNCLGLLEEISKRNCRWRLQRKPSKIKGRLAQGKNIFKWNVWLPKMQPFSLQFGDYWLWGGLSGEARPGLC